MAKKIKISLVRSAANLPRDQQDTVRSLGLRRTRASVIKEDTPAIRGMIQKIHHLVEVAPVDESQVEGAPAPAAKAATPKAATEAEAVTPAAKAPAGGAGGQQA